MQKALHSAKKKNITNGKPNLRSYDDSTESEPELVITAPVPLFKPVILSNLVSEDDDSDFEPDSSKSSLENETNGNFGKNLNSLPELSSFPILSAALSESSDLQANFRVVSTKIESSYETSFIKRKQDKKCPSNKRFPKDTVLHSNSVDSVSFQIVDSDFPPINVSPVKTPKKVLNTNPSNSNQVKTDRLNNSEGNLEFITVLSQDSLVFSPQSNQAPLISQNFSDISSVNCFSDSVVSCGIHDINDSHSIKTGAADNQNSILSDLTSSFREYNFHETVTNRLKSDLGSKENTPFVSPSASEINFSHLHWSTFKSPTTSSSTVRLGLNLNGPSIW